MNYLTTIKASRRLLGIMVVSADTFGSFGVATIASRRRS
jgi:hypothetical protein